jgi:pimeloyl-ACP methyl ester carboxylesterase
MPTPHACTTAPEIDKPLAQLLIGMGFRVVTFDPPGAFRSHRPPFVGMAEMLGCAEEAIAATGVATPVRVCGHSMASVCAIGLALERPDLVSRLLLVGTTTGPRAALRSGGMPLCWPWWSRAFWTFAIRGARLALGRGNLAVQKKLCRQTTLASFVNPALAPSLELHDGDNRVKASPRSVWAARIRAIDYQARLPAIHVETLVCSGRHDPQTTPTANNKVALGIRNARLVTFDRSGHYPFVEEPDRFRAVVGPFISA